MSKAFRAGPFCESGICCAGFEIVGSVIFTNDTSFLHRMNTFGKLDEAWSRRFPGRSHPIVSH